MRIVVSPGIHGKKATNRSTYNKTIFIYFILKRLNIITQGIGVLNNDYLIFFKPDFFILNVIQLTLYCNRTNNQKNGNHKLKHNQRTSN